MAGEGDMLFGLGFKSDDEGHALVGFAQCALAFILSKTKPWVEMENKGM